MKKYDSGCFIFGLAVIAMLVLSLLYVYAIATSDLPDWLIFWLLK